MGWRGHGRRTANRLSRTAVVRCCGISFFKLGTNAAGSALPTGRHRRAPPPEGGGLMVPTPPERQCRPSRGRRLLNFSTPVPGFVRHQASHCSTAHPRLAKGFTTTRRNGWEPCAGAEAHRKLPNRLPQHTTTPARRHATRPKPDMRASAGRRLGGGCFTLKVLAARRPRHLDMP